MQYNGNDTKQAKCYTKSSEHAVIDRSQYRRYWRNFNRDRAGGCCSDVNVCSVENRVILKIACRVVK